MLFPRDPYLMGLTPVATASESSAQTLQIARTMTAEAAPSAPAAEPQRFVGQAANAQPAEANAEAPGRLALSTTPASTSAAAQPVKRFVKQLVPDSILHDAALNEAIKVLPSNYNFEIHKTVWRIQQAGARHVALQFPEGLLMYACIISDILERFAGVEHVFILGDVTYGACCVDDFSAAALGAELLVHYGHSCLVPLDVTSLPCLYVFVDISIDVDHLVETVELNFSPSCRLALAGTIQFSSAIQLARQRLSARYPSLSIPKCKPLSPGEVLGCTAPALNADDVDAIVFVADGRFHLEAIMIANPSIPAYRYDPYPRVLTQEHYDQEGMRAVRRRAIERATSARRWCLVLGTLGRQGNPHILHMLQEQLARRGMEVTTLLMSEISPPRLAMIPDVEAFVQVACPRLSIDWGEGFARPTLTPFEALVTLGEVPGWWEQQQACPGSASVAATTAGDASASGRTHGGNEEGTVELHKASTRGLPGVPLADSARKASPYPMDYYAKEGGAWASSWHKRPVQEHKPAAAVGGS